MNSAFISIMILINKLTNYLKKVFSKRIVILSLFIIITFFLFSFLIVIFIPKEQSGLSLAKDFLINILMVVPILAATIFIIVAFRVKLNKQKIDFFSLRTKITLSLIIVGVVPSLIVLLIANMLMNQSLSTNYNVNAINSLKRSLEISYNFIKYYDRDIYNEVKYYKNNFYSENNILNYMKMNKKRYYNSGVYYIIAFNNDRNLKNIKIYDHNIYDQSLLDAIKRFLLINNYVNNLIVNNINNKNKLFDVYRVSNFNSYYSVGVLKLNHYIIGFIKEIPEIVIQNNADILNAYSDLKKQQFLKPYIDIGVGILLILISFLIIILSIIFSVVISKNISDPVFELVDASRSIAEGNFEINLKRDRQDELSILFESFNNMAKQLEHSQKIYYQTQKLQAWSEIARKLMHEIKNPLTPIRLSAERIYKQYINKHPDFENILKDGIQTIVDEINILTTMLSEFSKFARLPEAKMEPLNLIEVIEHCISLYDGVENLKINFQYEDNLVNIMGDKSLLRQVFINLIQNSIDAGSSEIKIVAKNDSKNKFININFKDNGKGIDKDKLDKIFEPSFTTKEHGMGIGLAIVEKIIINHNGDIICDSEPGKGAIFIIKLPVAK